MRYANWDVLLFPDGSKAPLQEFKTGCYVVQDPDLFLPELAPSIAASSHTLQRQLPTVTCFIPSQQRGSPFKISLYSWEAPTWSPEIIKIAARYSGTLCFEARILVDDVCFTGLLFNDKAIFPQILEASYLLNKDGKRDNLRFPQFRTEMLSQNYWNAGESIGRIKVIVSEGFLPALATLPFRRFKNLVSFSFQHAPLAVLERAGIAWPNQGMWHQPSQPYYDWSSPTKVDAKEYSDNYSHSPRRKKRPSRYLSNDPMSTGGILDSHMPIGPPTVPKNGPDGVELPWPPLLQIPDALDGSGHHYLFNSHAYQPSGEDQSILDFSHLITPTNIADNSESWSRSGAVSHAENEKTMDDSGTVHDPLTSFAIGFDIGGKMGTNNTTNDFVIGSVPEEISLAPLGCDHRVTKTATAFDKVHDALDISDPERIASNFHERDTQMKTSSKPVGKVGVKKERKVNRLIASQLGRRKMSKGPEDKENENANIVGTSISGEGKRKRTNNAKNPMTFMEENNATSSPPRKLPRTIVPKNEEMSPGRFSDDVLSLREPLNLLENIQ